MVIGRVGVQPKDVFEEGYREILQKTQFLRIVLLYVIFGVLGGCVRLCCGVDFLK